MDDQLMEQVFLYLKNSGEALAKDGFRLAYQQALNYGIADIVGGILLLLATLVSLIFFLKWVKKFPEEDRWETDQNDVKYWGFLLILPAILGVLNIFWGILIILNPSWYAIQMIINTIR